MAAAACRLASRARVLGSAMGLHTTLLTRSDCPSFLRAAFKAMENENVGFDQELSARMRTSYPLAAVVSVEQDTGGGIKGVSQSWPRNCPCLRAMAPREQPQRPFLPALQPWIAIIWEI